MGCSRYHASVRKGGLIGRVDSHCCMIPSKHPHPQAVFPTVVGCTPLDDDAEANDGIMNAAFDQGMSARSCQALPSALHQNLRRGPPLLIANVAISHTVARAALCYVKTYAPPAFPGTLKKKSYDYALGTNSISYPKPGMQMRSPLKDGLSTFCRCGCGNTAGGSAHLVFAPSFAARSHLYSLYATNGSLPQRQLCVLPHGRSYACANGAHRKWSERSAFPCCS